MSNTERNSIHTKLDEFKDILAKTSTKSLDLLNPGLAREEVEEKLSDLPFQISPDAVELYTWSDGVHSYGVDKFIDPLEILPGAYYISLDQALYEFNEFYKLKDQCQEIFYQKYFDSFRFLSDHSDGGYSFGRIDSPSNGCIVNLCIHHEWELAYQSLEHLIDTAIECRRRGVFRNHDMPDFEMYFKIGAELNKDMDLWKGY